MRTINIEFRETKFKPGDRPEIGHAPEVISEPTIFKHEGQTVGIYTSIKDHEWSEGLRAISMTTPVEKSARMSGVGTQSAVYGHLPAVHARNAFCRKTKISAELPKYHHGVEQCAAFINQIYKEHLPEAYEHNLNIVRENIEQDYILEGTVFTTCNFNFNHAIPYHRDTGNIKNVFSNVIIYKRDIVGGELVFPEWGITLAQDDGYIGIFDGQKYLHGVTPVKRTNEKGYRASIVFYALESMQNCLPAAEELQKAREFRHKVEGEFRNL